MCARWFFFPVLMGLLTLGFFMFTQYRKPTNQTVYETYSALSHLVNGLLVFLPEFSGKPFSDGYVLSQTSTRWKTFTISQLASSYSRHQTHFSYNAIFSIYLWQNHNYYQILNFTLHNFFSSLSSVITSTPTEYLSSHQFSSKVQPWFTVKF